MRFDQDGWHHTGAVCSGGITEVLFGTGLASLFGDGALATAGADALGGAAVGALSSAATGGKPLQGAITGGLTGGAVGGLGGLIGDAAGIGTTAGDAIAGAGAGALGSAITGQNPVRGAITGGAGGLAAGAIGGLAGGGGEAGGGLSGGPGAGAGALAAPASVAPSAGDIASGATAGFDTGAVPAGTELAAQDVGALNQQVALGGSGPVTSQGLAVTGSGQSFGTAADLTPGQATDLYNQGGGAVPGSAASGSDGLIDTPPAPPGAPPASGAATSGLGSVIAGTDPAGNLLPGAANLSTGGAGGVGSLLGKNASWLLPAAVLGYDALKSSQGLGNIPGYNNLTSTANQLGTQGAQLASYLQSGTLPPGVQGSLNQAGAAAVATIKSRYAAMGGSGSSAEAEDIANVQQTIAGQGAQIAQQLLTTGINESNLSASIYQQIMNANIQSDQQLGNALTTLAGAAARPTISINQQPAS
jgi:hypothetical protein